MRRHRESFKPTKRSTHILKRFFCSDSLTKDAMFAVEFPIAQRG